MQSDSTLSVEPNGQSRLGRTLNQRPVQFRFRLHHCTDRESLTSIARFGLLSELEMIRRGLRPARTGHPISSSPLDDFIRLSFFRNPPVVQEAITVGRILHPIDLEIDPVVLAWSTTLFAPAGADSEGPVLLQSMTLVEDDLFDFSGVVLVKTTIPPQFILNLGTTPPAPELPEPDGNQIDACRPHVARAPATPARPTP